jgi:hypothetical protein
VHNDRIIRGALCVSVVFNLGGALVLALPSSAIGQLAGLPAAVPPMYSTLLGLFVILFGGAYAWLARQTHIDRPLVAFSAIGKAGFFAITFILWLLGDATGRFALAATGDLILAGVFAWWLFNSEPAAAETGQVRAVN